MYIKKEIIIIYNKKQEIFKIIIPVSKYIYKLLLNSTINELNNTNFAFFHYF